MAKIIVEDMYDDQVVNTKTIIVMSNEKTTSEDDTSADEDTVDTWRRDGFNRGGLCVPFSPRDTSW